MNVNQKLREINSSLTNPSLSEIAIALHQHWFFDKGTYSTLLTNSEELLERATNERKSLQLASALRVAVQYRNVVMVEKIINFARAVYSREDSNYGSDLMDIINLRWDDRPHQLPSVIETFATSLFSQRGYEVTSVDLQIIALLGKAGANFMDDRLRVTPFVTKFLGSSRQLFNIEIKNIQFTLVVAEAVLNSRVGLHTYKLSPLEVAAQGLFAKIRARGVEEAHKKKPSAASGREIESNSGDSLVFDLSFLEAQQQRSAEQKNTTDNDDPLLHVLNSLSRLILLLYQNKSQQDQGDAENRKQLLLQLRVARSYINKLSHGTYHAEFIGPAMILLSALTIAAGLAAAPIAAVAAGAGAVVSVYGIWGRQTSMKSAATRVYDAAEIEAKVLGNASG